MLPDYKEWLKEHYSPNAQNTKLTQVRKIEDCYESLDNLFANGTIQTVIESLKYSKSDERDQKPNPSKIHITRNTQKGFASYREGLSSYKSAVFNYQKFLETSGYQKNSSELHTQIEPVNIIEERKESIRQRFALERDMQTALRRDITSLSSKLKIIDDGTERAVDSGLIDITCEDNDSIVVVELKAGKADSRAIGQILGYMGDLQEEEDGKTVRGILVAHDFGRRAKAAARVVHSLVLKKYSIEFKFSTEE